MSSSHLCLFGAIVCFGCTALFAAPINKPPAEVPGPREVDFSHIQGNKTGRYKVTVTVTAGAETYKKTFDMAGTSGGNALCEFVQTSMDNAGWTVKAGADSKLLITGKEKAAVTSCTITADNLPATELPTVRSVKK